MLPALIKIVFDENAVVCLGYRLVCVDVDDTACVLLAASRRLPVNVFPVVAELAFLFSHDEVGRIRMLLEPRTPTHGAQLWESCGKGAAPHDAIGGLDV